MGKIMSICGYLRAFFHAGNKIEFTTFAKVRGAHQLA